MIGDQIKQLRKTLGITQKEFGERIGVKSNTIGTYEILRSEPIDAVVASICREFHVNEIWLRTGEGEMFAQRTREEEIEDAVNSLLSGEPDSFKAALIVALSKLEDSQWNKIEDFAMGLLKAREGVEKQPETPEEKAARLEREGKEKDARIADLEKELAQLEGRGKPTAV